jgi:hypothetical protein
MGKRSNVLTLSPVLRESVRRDWMNGLTLDQILARMDALDREKISRTGLFNYLKKLGLERREVDASLFANAMLRVLGDCIDAAAVTLTGEAFQFMKALAAALKKV